MGSLYRRSPRGNWHAEYTGPDNRRVRKSTRTKNKQDAARILARWEADANHLRHGITSEAATDINELLTEWIRTLNRIPDSALQLHERLSRIFQAAEIRHPSQIQHYKIENAIRSFTSLNHADGRPLSLRTQSIYTRNIKSFSRWLTHTRKAIHADPLVNLSSPKKIEQDRKIIRRYLLPEEWTWLSRTKNALIYETAIQTGLRHIELAALRPVHVHRDHILLPAKHTKNREQAKQYISTQLAKRLTAALPFNLPIRGEAARQLFYPDLAHARHLWLATNPKTKADGFLQKQDSQGKQLDFHSLRHTCGAWLALQGISPKTIQAVMRHSSITLTLDTYGHLMPGAEQDAANTLSAMLRKCQ